MKLKLLVSHVQDITMGLCMYIFVLNYFHLPEFDVVHVQLVLGTVIWVYVACCGRFIHLLMFQRWLHADIVQGVAD